MKKKVLGYTFAIALIVAGWWITALLLASPALPTPDAAAAVMLQNTSTLVPFFATSTYRVVAGLVIGTVLAVPIAQVFARSRTLDALFAPVLYLLYPIPKVVLLPILLVLLGLADAPKIALIALTVFFQVLVAVRDAVKAIPGSAVLSIRSLGGSRWDEYRLARNATRCVHLAENRGGHSHRGALHRRSYGGLDRARVLHHAIVEHGELPAHVRRHHRARVARAGAVRMFRPRRAPSDALERTQTCLSAQMRHDMIGHAEAGLPLT